MFAKTRLKALATLGFPIDASRDALAEAALAVNFGDLDLDNPADAFEALRRFASADSGPSAYAMQ